MKVQPGDPGSHSNEMLLSSSRQLMVALQFGKSGQRCHVNPKVATDSSDKMKIIIFTIFKNIIYILYIYVHDDKII